jgi:multicomponent K+:H+ antiporter subunit G
MTATVPLWADVLTAAVVVVGGVAALIGSLGLLRWKSFFQRVHTPTLGATLGTWGLTAATVIQASFVVGQPYVHVLILASFLALTAPITTIFLMRAALFRARLRGDPLVPPVRRPGSG